MAGRLITPYAVVIANLSKAFGNGGSQKSGVIGDSILVLAVSCYSGFDTRPSIGFVLACDALEFGSTGVEVSF